MLKPRTVLHILMIEDSADDENLVRLVLEEGGCRAEVTRVADTAALRDRLAARAWDAILCDHHLPGFDSLHALDLVLAGGIEAPFVILSDSIPDELAIEAMRRGARDFIRKDQMSRLVPVLRRELSTVELARELDCLSRDMARLYDFDRLTGLPNREHLLRHLARLAADGQGQAGLLLADVNKFRRIGHCIELPLVNEALAEIGRRVAATAEGGNFAARVGGNTFAIVVHDGADEPAMQALALELMRQVGRALHVGPFEFFLSLSIGAACDAGGTEGIGALFARGEAALFEAKLAGGGSYRFFRPEMATADQRAILLEGALHRALTRREFLLHYQPQVELASGRVVSAEALLRWQHPTLGLVSPSEFVPMLERTALIVPVGAWIIDAACDQLRAWADAGTAPARVAVNLSAVQFGDPRLTEIVARALQRNGLAPERLEIEITENVVMEGKDDTLAVLRALRRLGVRIAVDDFGTGYSSLGYLKRFPITTLKIDQIFIRDCHQSTQDQALVEAIVAMGHRLGLEIVAEGVELGQHAEFLAAHRCDIGQGYHFGKPVPPDQFEMVATHGQIAIMPPSQFAARAVQSTEW